MSNPDPVVATQGGPSVDPSLVTYTHIIYGLHALAAFIGLTGAATVVGSFVFGLPSIVAVIMNYVRRSEVRGTWLQSHFTWQIRTFWWALFWAILIAAVSLVLAIVLIGFVTYWLGLVALAIWIIYRVARGWLALRDGRVMQAAQ